MMKRRTFLGLSLAAPAALAAQDARPPARSLVWLWMSGGMNPRDTWDPKPGVETDVPGVRISERLPRCATLMSRVALIRSLTTASDQPGPATEILHHGRHPYPRPTFAPIGTIVAHEMGKRGAPAPRYVSLDGPRVPCVDGFPRDDRPVGPHAFRAERPGDRLRATLDGALPPIWADRLLASPALKAFDLSDVPPAVQAAYGEGAFGRNCLFARRLADAGCPFIEVGLDGWEDPARVLELCATLDAGLSALLRDLDLTKTVVVCVGPYGRRDGRPWTRGFSAALAGGPIRGGRVIGDTGPEGRDCRDAVEHGTFLASVLKACGIQHGRYFGDGHTWTYVNHHAPLKELF